jgi:hypothetical protein
VTWVYVSDPTAEETHDASSPSHPTAISDTYQQVAAHTLEALSTAAADQTTSYPPQGTAYYTAANPQTDSHPEYGFVQPEAVGTTNGGPGSINYFLSNSTAPDHTDTSLIDPNLESTMGDATERAEGLGGQQDDTAHDGSGEADKEQEEDIAISESRLAITLRNFNELQA